VTKDRLTPRQSEAYDVIRNYLHEHQKPPTMQEIGDALDITSTNAVYKLLTALETKGWIEREKHSARGIRLLDEEGVPFDVDGGPPQLPIVSRTDSHEPERLRERPKGTLSVDDRLLRSARDPDACIVGRAGDDGMSDRGIRNGDLLLIEEMEWTDLENGVLVAALLQERLLPRRFSLANGLFHLRSTDRRYTEETFPPKHPGCYIIGRVRGLIRTL